MPGSKRLKTALYWIAQGIDLVPLQPNAKRIVGTFGAYSQHVRTEEQAKFWFGDRACNLGLVLGQGLIVLDFDSVAAYESACERWQAIGETYTERTRRGFHTFFHGHGGSGELHGFEILGKGSIATVAPSEVSGFTYRVEKRLSISRIPANFLLLSEKRDKPLSEGKQHDHDQTDTIGRIKAAYSTLELAQGETSLTSKDGRWWHGRCPFHDDAHASFWVDSERGTWSCYACKAHGDVINMYAMLHNLDVWQAIRDMASKL
jgi:hypothetical protein